MCRRYDMWPPEGGVTTHRLRNPGLGCRGMRSVISCYREGLFPAILVFDDAMIPLLSPLSSPLPGLPSPPLFVPFLFFPLLHPCSLRTRSWVPGKTVMVAACVGRYSLLRGMVHPVLTSYNRYGGHEKPVKARAGVPWGRTRPRLKPCLS